ncbi:potassium/sodium efflux P-type ATPase [Ramicandelaber brevisporus]|nr:potassium/sodium efflux P-type ATPase [Ramicandelaber brevisporus]KAI8868833.1 potassium/sodium efflux P-type ATPase [Ramicandelaber brevisporus]
MDRPYHTFTIDDAIHILAADPTDGLTSAEVSRRHEEHGFNELTGGSGISPWRVLFHQIANIMTLILVGALVISFVAKDWFEGGVIAGIIILNVGIGFMQEYRAEKTMDSLRRMASPTARVMRDGTLLTIPTREVAIGDVLAIESGDVVAADCRLIETFNLDIDEAMLTGESLPVNKDTNAQSDPNQPLGDRINMAFSSTTVTKGRGLAVVTAIGNRTEIGKIAKTISSATVSQRTVLQKSLDKMGLVLLVVALLMAVVVFGVNKFKFNADIAIYAISLAIAVIPEGLVAVVTLTMAFGVHRMAQNRALVRQLSALEAIGSVTTICSDKTGTLTQSKMVVTRMWLPEDGYYRVTGSGFEPTGEVMNGTVITRDTMSAGLAIMTRCAALCNMSMIKPAIDGEGWVGIGDPTEVALQVFAHKMNMGKPRLINPTGSDAATLSKPWLLLAEFPFDSTIKRMSVIYEEPVSGRIVVFIKGATERLAPICSAVQVGEKVQQLPVPAADGGDNGLYEQLSEQVERLAANGLRVLSLGYKVVDPAEFDNADPDTWPREELERNLIYLGMVGINDPPRVESRPSVMECYQAGINVHMLTGDHPATATAIAREIGILPSYYTQQTSNAITVGEQDVKLVMTATEFDALSDEEIDQLQELPHVIARCSPETKVKMIRALHRRGAITAMTGDGVNDAPSLKISDIGVSMGMQGSDVAKQASDIVLTDDNFATIVRAVEEGRRIFANIQKFIMHLVAGNVAELVPLVVGLAFMDATGASVYPMSPVQILVNNLLTSSPPAMSLGLESLHPDTMRRPPRPSTEGLFTWEVIGDILFYGVTMGLITLANFAIVVFGYGDGNLGEDCNSQHSDACETVFRARGAVFATLTLLILVHAYNARDMRESQWHWSGLGSRLVSNRYLLYSIGCGILICLLALYIPGVNHSIFKHSPIGWEWGMVFASIFLFLIIAETYKFAKRKWMAPRFRARTMGSITDRETTTGTAVERFTGGIRNKMFRRFGTTSTAAANTVNEKY